jgi:tryptophan synthase alpha subunit
MEAKIILPDGQTVDLPEEVAKDDTMLRDSLSQYVPEIRNAELKRTTKDGQMVVTVVKKAGVKGLFIPDFNIEELRTEVWRPIAGCKGKILKGKYRARAA